MNMMAPECKAWTPDAGLASSVIVLYNRANSVLQEEHLGWHGRHGLHDQLAQVESYLGYVFGRCGALRGHRLTSERVPIR